jgi:HD-GYP domain-containing protein (c-di-GMP phosphodiesterase class II)
MGLPSEKLEVLHRGGLLHDIGKIGVPRELLDLHGQLTPEQMAAVRRHPVIGARILEPIRAFAPALPIVLQHHERWDGGGYPQGLSGTEIDPLARVVAVADSFDAMASARPYRAGLEFSVIVREIVEGAGRQFDPEVVTAFRRIGANREALVLASPEGAA